MERDAQAFKTSNTERIEDYKAVVRDKVRSWQRRFGIERTGIFGITKAIEIPLIKYSFNPSGRDQTAQFAIAGHS